MSWNRMRVAVPALASLLLGIGTAGAEGLAYELSVGAGTTDNVRRVESGAQDETVGTAQIQFSLDERTRRLTADIAANLAYNDYLDETYESELLGNFAGAGTFALIEDRLFLMASDYFGQVLGDPLAPANPDNRENLNYLTGGMRTIFRLGSDMALDLAGSYAIATYETTPLDSTNLVWDVGLTRNFAAANSLGLRARHAQLEYDELVDALNYDQSELFVRYSIEGARSIVSLDAGYTSIDRELAGSDSGVLFRVDASRSISGRSTLSLGAGQEYSSSAAAFASTQSGEVIGLATQSSQQTGFPFINRYARLGWNLQGSRTGLTMLTSWNEQVYDDLTGFDQSFITLAALVTRDLNAALRADFNATHSRGKFQLRGGEYTDSQASLGLRWQMSRYLSLSLAYAYLDRSSNTTGGDYAENRLWLLFNAQRGSPRITMRPSRFAKEDAN